jgi:hypothetical protein
LIITPQFTNIVSAAFPITLADWDDVASGLDSGTSGYFTFKSMATADYFQTSTDGDLSTPNSFMIECRDNTPQLEGEGYWNLTQSYSYIGYFNFSFYKHRGSAAGGFWYFKFYDSDDNMIMNLKFTGVTSDLEFYDVSTGWKTVYNNVDDATRYYAVITHNGTNQFNVKCLNSAFAVVGNLDCAGSYAGTYTNFSYIYVDSLGPSGTGDSQYFYVDNIIIDTTWSGTGTPPAGYLSVNCFDEVSGANITDFNMVAVNQVGDTFFDYNLNNTYVVSGVLLPQGETTITISALNYYPRSYLVDIESGYFVIDGVTYATATIDAYLPLINNSKLYYIRVINDFLYPLDEAAVLIQGLCANTSYETISNTRTDGDGYTMAYLVSGRNYQVTISKEGYDTKTETWIPDPNYYGISNPKTFRLSLTGNENVTYAFWELITFTGTMYSNNSIKVTFIDNNYNTTNAQFYTYELYNFTSTLISTNTTTNDTFIFWVTGVNISRTHRVDIFLNHTVLGFNHLSILISPINYSGKLNTTEIEKTITDVFGDLDPLGFINFCLVYLPAIIILILPGPTHPVIGIIGSGLWMGIVAIKLSLPPQLAILIPFIIAIGVILVIVKGGGSKL